MELIVTTPFLAYTVGELISDPAVISTLLPQYADDVVKIGGGSFGGGATETLGVLDVQAEIGIPCRMSGSVTNSALAGGLQWSLNSGGSWTAVTGLTVSGASWSGYGPTFQTSGPVLTLSVRDAAVPTVSVSAPAFSVDVAPGVLTVAGLSGSISAVLLKGALDIGVADVSGLGDVATADFGTVSGSVADGGVVTALAGSIAGIVPASQANVVSALSAGGLAHVCLGPMWLVVPPCFPTAWCRPRRSRARAWCSGIARSWRRISILPKCGIPRRITMRIRNCRRSCSIASPWRWR